MLRPLRDDATMHPNARGLAVDMPILTARGRTVAERAGTWAARGILVAGALLAIRIAVPMNEDALRRSSEEFDFAVALSSARAILALLLLALAGCLFALACRLPVRVGVSVGPLLLGLVPLALLAHLPLMYRLGEEGWFQRFYFFDHEAVRWMLAGLVGVAWGSALGRSSVPSWWSEAGAGSPALIRPEGRRRP